MSDAATTFGERISQYDRRVHMCTWLGASLAGYIALVVGNVIPENPIFFKPIIVSLLLIAATSAAFTLVGFEWSATILRRKLEKNNFEDDSPLPQELLAWPASERWWGLFLWSYFLSGAFLFIALWWTPIQMLVSLAK